MRLSVIIPVYNVKEYLKRCVDSVIKQDYFDYEIILIDDGSTDGSDSLCDKLAENNGSILVIHKENGGLSSARNAGIKAAKGQYLMFLDSDDWIEAGSLSEFDSLMVYNYDLIMGRAWVIDERGNKKSKLPYKIPIGLYESDVYLKGCLRDEHDVSFCSPFYLYKREYVLSKNLWFYEGILHEDELWMPLALLRSETVYVSDIYFYNHFVRSGSIMHSNNYGKSAVSTLTVCKELNKEYDNYPDDTVRWLRNRMSMLFLRSVPQLKTRKGELKDFRRSFPVVNSFTPKQKMKSFIYYISPELYCWLVGKIRGYSTGNESG